MLTIIFNGMKENYQHALNLTAPVREARGRAGKRRVQNPKRKILVIDYQTWLSLTDHLITGLPSQRIAKRR
ncbi:hypothetical protein [Variovorax sp. RCC_210]|uniref:hypothetical protein n=1 Tax=Variovorax sp. RCC_210 TaxID=3239217 RepID=UPI001045AF86